LRIESLFDYDQTLCRCMVDAERLSTDAAYLHWLAAASGCWRGVEYRRRGFDQSRQEI